jgi:Flp pilus assembly protein TadD
VPKPGEVAPSLQQPSGDATDSLKVPASDVSTDELINEGQKLYAAGKYDDALAKFVESQGKNPNNPAVYNNIGLVYKKKNNFSQAENYYKKALAIKPDYAECLNNMGVLKAAAGDTLEAALSLKKAISVVSTYADAYFNLAVLNDEEGNFKEAIANYKSFLLYTETSDESLITKVKDRIDQISE